jgi:hypothetical protein
MAICLAIFLAIFLYLLPLLWEDYITEGGKPFLVEVF